MPQSHSKMPHKLTHKARVRPTKNRENIDRLLAASFTVFCLHQEVYSDRSVHNGYNMVCRSVAFGVNLRISIDYLQLKYEMLSLANLTESIKSNSLGTLHAEIGLYVQDRLYVQSPLMRKSYI